MIVQWECPAILSTQLTFYLTASWSEEHFSRHATIVSLFVYVSIYRTLCLVHGYCINFVQSIVGIKCTLLIEHILSACTKSASTWQYWCNINKDFLDQECLNIVIKLYEKNICMWMTKFTRKRVMIRCVIRWVQCLFKFWTFCLKSIDVCNQH